MPTRDVWAKQSLMGGREEQVYLDSRVREPAVLLAGAVGRVCVGQRMPRRPLPIRCPEQPHSAFGGGGNKGNSMCLLPCPRVSWTTPLPRPSAITPYHLLLPQGIWVSESGWVRKNREEIHPDVTPGRAAATKHLNLKTA